MSTSKFDMEKFNGKNDFTLWKLKMIAVLVQQGLADAIKETDKSKDEKVDPKIEEMREKAHSAIILCLSDRVLREVAKETTAAAVWKKLESIYLTKSLANRLYMKQRLYSYKFLEGKSVTEQMEDFTKSIDDLENIDSKINDEDKAILLLNALPWSYEHLKDAMLFGREGSITFEEVQSALKAKEFSRNNTKSVDVAAESLNVKSGGKKFTKGKKSGNDKFKNQQKEQDGKETRSCHYCKKPGHLKKNCFAWKRKQSESKEGQDTADVAQEVEVGEIMNVTEAANPEVWVMDSGCSFHMTPNRSWYIDLQESQGSVLLGNNQVCYVKGIGSVRLVMEDGSQRILSEVRFIPTIKRNLVSLGALEKKGFSFTSADGVLKVMKGASVLMTAERVNNLYYLKAKAVDSGHLNVSEKLKLAHWHLRLGHLGQGGLKELAKMKLISYDEDAEGSGVSSCEECVLGKSKKLPYVAGKHTSSEPLEYAHADIWGPSPVQSMGGGRYFLSIIDDFSRKIWIYILREKSEAYEKFQEWCSDVEHEKGKVLKCLRTDNGLEFLSAEFDSFCKKKGIKRHRTMPHNPQQNGVAERANRTILERLRCMLISSGMSKNFWAEAASTAVLLINKCPSAAIENQTPDMKWYGSAGDYTKLRAFGCRAYAHAKKTKLDPRAIKCVMLGYQKGVKGYRLWCTEKGMGKVVISRDVIFREEEMPYSEKKSDKTQFEVELPREEETANEQISDQSSDNVSVDEENEQEKSHVIARDRGRRKINLPSRFNDYNMMYYTLTVAEEIECHEPSSYKEAVRTPEKDKWLRAMQEEIDSLYKNQTWILVLRPKHQKAIGCKWVFKKKVEAFNYNKVRFKARLVAKGFTHREGIDYNEIFSPVVKHASIRILLAIVNQRDWELQQMDVKTAFLNGDLEEKIYMEQPEAFVKKGDEDKVCQLKRSLYGLKQSSRQWYIRFDEFIKKIGFEKSCYDSCVFIKKKHGIAVAYLLLYVDDMLVAAATMQEVEEIKKGLESEFDMKDLGNAKRILGMDIIRHRKEKRLWLTQKDYICKLLKRFQMDQGRSVTVPLGQQFKLSTEQSPKTEEERREMMKIPYASIVGSVMYTMVCSRPDVSHAISVTSRFMSDPGLKHWHGLKWILRYLRGTSDYGILFKGSQEVGEDPLVGYCDSDFTVSQDTRKSQSGYIFCLYGSAISWKSNLQSVVALSTIEAEYISLTEAVKESLWLKGILSDFGVEQRSIAIKCDSNSAISLSKHQTFHERSKHVDVKLHFIRDEVNRGKVKIEKVSIDDNAADMLTKTLPSSKLRYCLELVNLIQ